MQVRREGMKWDEPREGQQTLVQTCCPVCNGPLIETRSLMRCVRCSFTICEACAGEAFSGEIESGY